MCFLGIFGFSNIYIWCFWHKCIAIVLPIYARISATASADRFVASVRIYVIKPCSYNFCAQDIVRLEEKYNLAVGREQSYANRMLGAVSIGAGGIGGMMLQETGQAFSWTGLLSLTLIVCGVWIVNKGDKRQDD